MMNPKKPGQGLRELRLSKDFKQKSVAYDLGTNIKKYQRMEAGKTKIALTDVPSIAKALGVTENEVLQAEGILMTNHFKNQNGHNIGYVNTFSGADRPQLENRVRFLESKLENQNQDLKNIKLLLEKVLSKLAD